MKLKELKATIDSLCKHATSHKTDDLEVVVQIAEPSIGASACVGINWVTRGIDWESGRINITPSKELVRKGNSKEDVIAPREELYDYGNGKKRIIRDCKMCDSQVRKDDRYCSKCGQKIK